MSAILNIVVIAFVALIAYWWANQGVLSALLHFVCVVVAGAMTLAIWEPLATLMLSRGILANYAWGIAMLLPFAIFLFLTRLAADKLVPDNLNLPQWANMVFGGLLGAAAGVLTVGFCLLGAGFTQSTVELAGFQGVVRTNDAKGQPDFDAPGLWFPAHRVTERFYGQLSAGALWPEFGRPLDAVYPKLADQALSLHRDSFSHGEARTSAPPSAITINSVWWSPDYKNPVGPPGAYVVDLDVGAEATDSGSVLTVSASQVRLLGRVPDGSSRPAAVVYPMQWSQPNEAGTRSLWQFDDQLNYATNVPGQQLTKFQFVFPAGAIGPPEQGGPAFVQFKGLRFPLPPLDPVAQPFDEMVATLRGASGGGIEGPLVDPNAKTIRSSDIKLDASIAPANASINQLTTMEQVDQYLTEGVEEFQRGGSIASPSNRIKGIFTQDGTGLVRLNISRRTSSIDLWNDRTDLRETAGESASLYLVDSLGNRYTPIGYLWIKPDGVEVRLAPKEGIPTIGDFPNQPSSGSHELFALFNPTAGVRIVSIRLGDKVVANADLEVRDARQ